MKVLFVINNLGSGGAERVLVDLITELSAKNINVELALLSSKNSVYLNDIYDIGIKVHILKYENIKDPRNILELVKLIKTNNYTIIHSHLFPSQYWVSFARLILRRADIKYVTTEHSTYNRRRNIKIFKLLDRIVYKNYNKIVSVSNEIEDNLKSWIKLEADKFRIIYNGINLNHFKECKAYNKDEFLRSNNIKINVESEPIILCMVGRFSPAKDQNTIIRSLSLLPEYVHLILLGEGNLMNQSIDLTKSLNLIHRVHFLGYQKEICKYLKLSDIIILSSNWEGFGLSAIEGMICGKPVIVSNVDGLVQTVGEAGIKFQRGDEIDLSNKIKYLLSNKEEMIKKSRESTKQAEKYDIERNTKSLMELYSQLMESGESDEI